MSGALFRKELRELWPLVAGLTVMEVLGLSMIVLAKPLDELRWSENSVLLSPTTAPFVGIVVFAVSVVAAYMLYPREHDQRTIEFLYSLPVGPEKVFSTKVLAAMTVLLAFHTADTLFLALIHQANGNTLSGSQFRVSLWLTESLLVGAFTLICLGYGLLLSFFRRLGLLLALFVWTAIHVVALFDPRLKVFDPLSLLVVNFRGSAPLVPMGPWLAHGVMALLSAFVARWLWLEHGTGFTHFYARASRSRVVRVVSGTALVGVLLMLGLLLGYNMRPKDDDEGMVTRSTRYLHFRYLAADHSGAVALAEEADEYVEGVQTLLGASPPRRIVADLSDESPEHLGIAGWQKIRLERSVLEDPHLRAHVLVHELAHVFAAVESDRRLVEHVDDAHFYSEGLAEWTAYELVEGPVGEAAMRTLAATAWEEFELSFDALISRPHFLARHDEWLTYALGFVWVDSLATVCGRQAPGDVLRAMGREGAPTYLHGRRWWEDNLQSANCELGAVNARMASSLAQTSATTKPIPMPEGGVVEVNKERIVFEVALDGFKGPDPVWVAVRLRDPENHRGTGIVQKLGVVDGRDPIRLELQNQGVPGEPFDYQLGVEYETDQPMFFQRWRTALR